MNGRGDESSCRLAQAKERAATDIVVEVYSGLTTEGQRLLAQICYGILGETKRRKRTEECGRWDEVMSIRGGMEE